MCHFLTKQTSENDKTHLGNQHQFQDNTSLFLLHSLKCLQETCRDILGDQQTSIQNPDIRLVVFGFHWPKCPRFKNTSVLETSLGLFSCNTSSPRALRGKSTAYLLFLVCLKPLHPDNTTASCSKEVNTSSHILVSTNTPSYSYRLMTVSTSISDLCKLSLVAWNLCNIVFQISVVNAVSRSGSLLTNPATLHSWLWFAVIYMQ